MVERASNARIARRSTLSTLFACALAGLSMTGGAAAEPRVAIALGPDARGEGLVAEIAGEWSGGCLPSLNTTTIRSDGADITIQARPDGSACKAGPAPFRLVAPIEFSSTLPDALRVRFEAQLDPLDAPRLQAFELIPIGDTRPARPEGGFWWGEAGGEFDHAAPGMGAQLERQGELLALTFSGYDADGEPEWLFGASPLSSAISDIRLNRLSGGSGPYGGFRKPGQAESGGRLQIEWLGPARAVFWFSRPAADGRTLELRPVSMVRFDFGLGPGRGWVGDWLLDRGESQPLARLRFESLVEQESGFVLQTGDGTTLSCQRAAALPESPPVGCELSLAGQETPIPLWEVGLNRVSGQLSAGEPVSLIRIESR